MSNELDPLSGRIVAKDGNGCSYDGLTMTLNWSHGSAKCPIGPANSNRGHMKPQPKLTKQQRARAAARTRAKN